MYKSFQKAVIDNFTAEYAAGRTPVPCTHCNGKLKFDLLFQYADAAGYDAIATGHYVYRDSGARLWTASCPAKDQTYYLWQIKQHLLPRLRFPLGTFRSKQDARDLALKLGIITHDKPDSQNICFIKNNYRETLQQLAPETFTPRQGVIDLQGKPIGNHLGYWNYTVGQRIGVSGWPNKLFVRAIDSVNNIVYATEVAAETLITQFAIQDSNWHHNHDPNGEYWIKTGAHSTPVKAQLVGNQVLASSPVRATPGQSCVFYTRFDSEFLLEGGAWISS
jgi:tRNA-specific 2-thiouridylase